MENKPNVNPKVGKAVQVDLDDLHLQDVPEILSLRTLYKIFHYSNDAIFIIDPVADRILAANPKASEMLGYSVKELITLPVSAIHPTEMDSMLAFYQSVSAEDYGWTSELSCRTKAGYILPAEISASIADMGEQAVMIALVRDISGRKAAEKALEKLASVTRQTADLVMITDRQGVIEFVNPAFETLTGYAAQEVVGQIPTFLKSNMHDAAFYTELWQAILAGDPFRATFINRKKNGDLYYEEKTITPLKSAEGSITHFVATAKDITVQEQIKSEREQLIQELEAFTHTVAHDLKNPLNLILGYADVLAREWQDFNNAEVSEYLHTILHTGQKMNAIINALLLLASARYQEIEVMPLEMSRIVKSSLENLTLMIAEREAEILLPDEWPIAVGYPPWVEEIWSNYLSNALKYGGTPPRIRLGAEANPGNGKIRFWVQDNGSGLTSNQQSRLFRPFTRLHEQGYGHGLGLSIVRQIAERLNGSAGVESVPGQGSRFFFTLPAAELS